MAPKKQSYSDYGINVAHQEWCPRCEQSTLIINEKEESWSCSNSKCHWRGRLLSPDRSPIMDAEQAAPALVRWHVTGPPEGMSYGWPSLDNFVKAVRGEWTLLTGYGAHGKSHLMDAAMVNMMGKGWKFATYATENTPYERHVKGLAQKFLGKRFSECTVDEIRLAQAWLKDKVYFIEPAEPTLEAVIAQFWKLAKEKKIHGVIIDPWNEIEHMVPMGMTETQYTARALIKFRRLCEAAHVHGWIVAHPSKIQTIRKAGDESHGRPVVRLADVSGSSHFENKCFFGLSVWRKTNSDKKDDQGHDERHVNCVYILKARNEDMGKVGMVKLVWDPKSTGYYEYHEQAMGEPVAKAVQEKLDRLYGRWQDFPEVKRPRDQDDIQSRLAQWKNDKGVLTFADGEVVATVKRQSGGGEIVWEASIKSVKLKEPLEAERAVKEEALDWCEQHVMRLAPPKEPS